MFVLTAGGFVQVMKCPKRYVHDWRSCPFAHPTENARRRDPREVRYMPVPCPDYKRGLCLMVCFPTLHEFLKLDALGKLCASCIMQQILHGILASNSFC